MNVSRKVFLVVAVILAYFPILGNDFLYSWDDQWVVMNRYTESGFNLINLWNVFFEFYHRQYAPLNEMFYLILHSLFGYNPFFFHLSSMLLHVVNVLLVYLCVEQFLLINVKIKSDNYSLVAFFTALIFAVHPFNVEAVAWMSASKILVYSFYYLLATYCFIQYIKQQKIKYYIFTLLFFVCSFLGKEQAVTFPLWMLLIYWYTGHSLKDGKLWIKVVPFLVLSLVFGFVTISSQATGGVLLNESSYPVWQRAVFACYTFFEYLFKSLFPFRLSYLYPFPNIVGDPLPSWLLIYPLLVVILFMAFWRYLSTNKVLTFCILFFSIHLVVVLHLIGLSRFAIVADRYAYIATLGVCFALSYWIVHFFARSKKQLRVVVSVLFGSYILYLGIYANVRSRVWFDTNTLKKEVRGILKQRGESQGKTYKTKEIEKT